MGSFARGAGSVVRLCLLVLGSAAVLAASGCTTPTTLSMSKAFPVSGWSYPSGPAVTLLPIQETPLLALDDDYRADLTYLGRGVSELGLVGPQKSLEFHSDIPRTDVIKKAFFAWLKNRNIPVSYQRQGGSERLMVLPEDHLGVSLRLREFVVGTRLSRIQPMQVEFHGRSAHAILDCQLWQAGQTRPLWEGIVEGKRSSDEFEKSGYQHGNVLGEAVIDAIDQCLAKSGLVDLRAALSGQRYTKLLAAGRKQEQEGSPERALETYGEACETAITPEQDMEAIKAMAKVLPQAKPVLSQEARQYKAQAEQAIGEKRLAEAAQSYHQALRLSPWWAAGHFSRALILSELGEYTVAIDEMTRYLFLKPDAADARAAHDKISEWEAKASQPPQAGEAAAPPHPRHKKRKSEG